VAGIYKDFSALGSSVGRVCDQVKLGPYGLFAIADCYDDRHGVTEHGEAISHHVCGRHGVVTASRLVTA